MKNNIFLLLVLLINASFLGIAQDKKDTNLYNRFSVMYSPVLTYRFLHTDNSQSGLVLKKNLDSIESIDLGYAFGLNYRHMFGKHLGVNLGLNYSVFNERTRNGSIDKFTNYETSSSYFSIPLQLIYNVNFMKKINYYFITGISQNFLFEQKQRVYNELKNEENIFNTNYDLKKSILFWNAGLGINFRLNRNFSFSSELIFNQSTSEINIDGIVKKSVFSVGPNFNFGYSF
jgi:hypothetical protein